MLEEFERGARVGEGQLCVVVGAGRSGKAAVELLLREKAKVRFLEKNAGALTEAEQKTLRERGVELIFGEHKKTHFSGARFVISSPGIPRASLEPFLDQESLRRGSTELIAEMELAWRYLDDEPVLAVTGTSGKTTTVSLCAAMLKAQGLSVFLGGNIGTPLSEYVLDGRKADVLVLEISSFQLQCCSTFAPRVACLLNISPNHLDYHKDMKEYTDAKFRLFRWQDENDLAVLGEGLEESARAYNLRARKIFVRATDRFPKTRLIGEHNRFNAEAAWNACRFFGVSMQNAEKAVADFQPLPNRLERVREHNGVLFVNDSKCTTVSALEVALRAFERPVRLLCGGKFKGGDLAGLSDLVREKVREVGLFGASREHFEGAWKGIVPISWHPVLKEAVTEVFEHAERGDVVLLAPATSSFDLYANYVERGRDFRRIVEALK
ncbi:MAG: UDP-N-acetylmuramoyl-L-alanine--D-glutamate ligase [Desulfovibrio sp.]|nr:UDP-N-acetylmuramoyl-L-alanine--D-glutamate ligase [Desulfovibrio sp.]